MHNVRGVPHIRILESVLVYFEGVFGIKLQIEGEGCHWTSLEAELSVDPTINLIAVAMQQQGNSNDPMHKQWLCFHDCHSLNANVHCAPSQAYFSPKR